MIKVVLVDDDVLIREGLRLIIEQETDLEVSGQAADGKEAVAMVDRLQPDVVLMDIRMPLMDGLAATAAITATGDARVIILTTFELDEYVFEALRAGASGFLLKRTPPEQLLEAIRVVAAGEALLAPSVTKKLIEAFAARPQRERESSRVVDCPRERSAHRNRARALQPGPRRRAVHLRQHRQDTRQTSLSKDWRARPRPGSGDRVRGRPDLGPYPIRRG